MNKIHGHDVMKMMVESDKVYTKDSLLEDIVKNFGDDARFYTCSADNMSASELIDFLNSRGKFSEQIGGFKTDQTKICND